jgi:(R)-2-hydroxyacyl-CoA dehydratese activating ATPase
MIVAGIDIGSTTTKVVLIDESGVVSRAICLTGANIENACETVLKDSLKKIKKNKTDIKYIMTTGYGRRGIDYGNETITEISANAKGAFLTNNKTRVILDIGGQDTKTISLDSSGVIQKFVMNDKCAAGTGRFIEVIARVMQEDLDHFAQLSLQSTNPAVINSTCTVFAESEVISLIAQKVKKVDIIAGVNRSIAKRIADMVRQVGVTPLVLFDGGGSKNVGILKELKDILGCEIFVPENPEFIVAYGAASLAYDKARKM